MKKIEDSYYFMSVGEKTYFYTLNYSYLADVYHTEDGVVQPVPVKERKYSFIRNLSHDFDTAVLKAKEWHKENASGASLRLLDGPMSMSARDQQSLADRMEIINKGVLTSGKYEGEHVSNVPMDYILWVLINVYRHDDTTGHQNILAQICYNHAEEKGWLDQWVKRGQEFCNEADGQKLINNSINQGVFLVGKYRGQAFADVAFTKKGELKKNFVEYANWMKSQHTVVDEIIKKFALEPQILDDGLPYFVFDNAQIQSLNGSLNDFSLTVLMLRQIMNKRTNEGNKDQTPLYHYHWVQLPLSVQEALVHFNRHRREDAGIELENVQAPTKIVDETVITESGSMDIENICTSLEFSPFTISVFTKLFQQLKENNISVVGHETDTQYNEIEITLTASSDEQCLLSASSTSVYIHSSRTIDSDFKVAFDSDLNVDKLAQIILAFIKDILGTHQNEYSIEVYDTNDDLIHDNFSTKSFTHALFKLFNLDTLRTVDYDSIQKATINIQHAENCSKEVHFNLIEDFLSLCDYNLTDDELLVAITYLECRSPETGYSTLVKKNKII